MYGGIRTGKIGSKVVVMRYMNLVGSCITRNGRITNLFKITLGRMLSNGLEVGSNE